jgi:hypothetical protein
VTRARPERTSTARLLASVGIAQAAGGWDARGCAQRRQPVEGEDVVGNERTQRKSRPRRGDEERALALAALDANAGNVARTARELALPRKTLEGWARGRTRPPPAQLRHQKREQLADALEAVVRRLLGVAAAAPIQIKTAADLVKVMTAAGIAIDKMLLLRCESAGAAGGPRGLDGPADAERSRGVAELQTRPSAAGAPVPWKSPPTPGKLWPPARRSARPRAARSSSGCPPRCAGPAAAGARPRRSRWLRPRPRTKHSPHPSRLPSRRSRGPNRRRRLRSRRPGPRRPGPSLPGPPSTIPWRSSSSPRVIAILTGRDKFTPRAPFIRSFCAALGGGHRKAGQENRP